MRVPERVTGPVQQSSGLGNLVGPVHLWDAEGVTQPVEGVDGRLGALQPTGGGSNGGGCFVEGAQGDTSNPQANPQREYVDQYSRMFSSARASAAFRSSPTALG